MNGMITTALFSILLTVTSACCNAPVSQQPEPKSEMYNAPFEIQLVGRVNDAARLLNETESLALSLKLEELERVTGHQLVLVTVPSLGGQNIDKYTVALANRWGIGRKKINDGVVLLIAPSERKVRIEVGLGLENTLTNELCKQIIDQKIVPYFKQGFYYEGIEAGTDELIKNLKMLPAS